MAADLLHDDKTREIWRPLGECVEAAWERESACKRLIKNTIGKGVLNALCGVFSPRRLARTCEGARGFCMRHCCACSCCRRGDTVRSMSRSDLGLGERSLTDAQKEVVAALKSLNFAERLAYYRWWSTIKPRDRNVTATGLCAQALPFVLLALYIGFCTFFVVTFATFVGPEAAEDWLISYAVSFFGGALVLQPATIFLSALMSRVALIGFVQHVVPEVAAVDAEEMLLAVSAALAVTLRVKMAKAAGGAGFLQEGLSDKPAAIAEEDGDEDAKESEDEGEPSQTQQAANKAEANVMAGLLDVGDVVEPAAAAAVLATASPSRNRRSPDALHHASDAGGAAGETEVLPGMPHSTAPGADAEAEVLPGMPRGATPDELDEADAVAPSGTAEADATPAPGTPVASSKGDPVLEVRVHELRAAASSDAGSESATPTQVRTHDGDEKELQ